MTKRKTNLKVRILADLDERGLEYEDLEKLEAMSLPKLKTWTKKNAQETYKTIVNPPKRGGYQMIMRDTPAYKELLKRPDAICLMLNICENAKYTMLELERNPKYAYMTKKGEQVRLKPNQAVIGNYSSYGMTERTYRTAKKTLAKLGLVHFDGRPGKGTIATILNEDFYVPGA